MIVSYTMVTVVISPQLQAALDQSLAQALPSPGDLAHLLTLADAAVGRDDEGCALALTISRLLEARDSHDRLDALNARLLAWYAARPDSQPQASAWRIVLADGLALAALHSGAPQAVIDRLSARLLDAAAAASAGDAAEQRLRLRALATGVAYSQLAGKLPLRIELDAMAEQCIARLSVAAVEIGRWWVDRTLAEIFTFNTEHRADPPIETLLARTEAALSQCPDALTLFKHRRNQFEWARVGKDPGAASQALESMREAQVAIGQRCRALSIVLHRAKALLASELGDSLAAERFAREAIVVAEEIAAPGNVRMSLWSTLGTVLSLQHRVAEAADAIERAANLSSAQHREVLEILAELHRARAVWNADPVGGALHLRSAISRARSIGYSQFLVSNPVLAAWTASHALALDIEPAFVRDLIAARRLQPPTDAGPTWPWTVRISLLGGWSIEGEGINLAGGKAQQKPMQVIQMLAIAGPKGLDRTRLARSVYGSAMLDSPATLNMAISRARRLLGDDNLIDSQGSRIRLDPNRIHVDLWEMDAMRPAEGEAARAQCRRLVQLYGGSLLHGTASAQEHRLLAATVRDRFVGLLLERIAVLDDAEALACLRAAIASEPAVEALYRALIERLAARGDAAEAIAAYRQCEIALDEAYGVVPSDRTRRVIETLRSSASTRLAPVVNVVRPDADAMPDVPARLRRRKSVA